VIIFKRVAFDTEFEQRIFRDAGRWHPELPEYERDVESVLFQGANFVNGYGTHRKNDQEGLSCKNLDAILAYIEEAIAHYEDLVVSGVPDDGETWNLDSVAPGQVIREAAEQAIMDLCALREIVYLGRLYITDTARVWDVRLGVTA
jgi:hypothetical protein